MRKNRKSAAAGGKVGKRESGKREIHGRQQRSRKLGHMQPSGVCVLGVFAPAIIILSPKAPPRRPLATPPFPPPLPFPPPPPVSCRSGVWGQEEANECRCQLAMGVGKSIQ